MLFFLAMVIMLVLGMLLVLVLVLVLVVCTISTKRSTWHTFAIWHNLRWKWETLSAKVWPYWLSGFCFRRMHSIFSVFPGWCVGRVEKYFLLGILQNPLSPIGDCWHPSPIFLQSSHQSSIYNLKKKNLNWQIGGSNIQSIAIWIDQALANLKTTGSDFKWVFFLESL